MSTDELDNILTTIQAVMQRMEQTQVTIMSNMVFVPLTDEILYEHPELIRNRLVPYQVGVPCFHWLKEAEVEIEYPDGRREAVSEHAA